MGDFGRGQRQVELQDRRWRLLMRANLVVAVSIILFWVGFYTELIFPKDELARRIAHFEGYYAWESSFTLPDTILAMALFWSAFSLLRTPWHVASLALLSACSGALIFLGVLDFNYSVRNGMYLLGHPFSWMLLCLGLFLPLWGILNLCFASARLRADPDRDGLQA